MNVILNLNKWRLLENGYFQANKIYWAKEVNEEYIALTDMSGKEVIERKACFKTAENFIGTAKIMARRRIPEDFADMPVR